MNINFTDEEAETFGTPIGIICYDVEKDELNFRFGGHGTARTEECVAILNRFIQFKNKPEVDLR
jgi:hypothetical protein